MPSPHSDEIVSAFPTLFVIQRNPEQHKSELQWLQISRCVFVLKILVLLIKNNQLQRSHNYSYCVGLSSRIRNY